MKNQKGISSILIILIIVGVLVAAGGVWYWQSQKKECLKEGETESPNVINCCEGLKAYTNYKLDSMEKCVQIVEPNKHLVCINCGNNICEQGENTCNCPQDCQGKAACVGEKEMCGGIAGILCCSGLKCQFEGGVLGETKPDASGTCVKQEKKDETANWKTYRNEKYGFEFKYPEEELIYPPLKTYEKQFQVNDKIYSGISFGEFHSGCHLVIIKTSRDPTLDPFDESSLPYEQWQYAVSKKLDSGEAFYHLGMSTASHAVSPEDCKSMLNQILSTFKFPPLESPTP